jgi:hypothetical protein
MKTPRIITGCTIALFLMVAVVAALGFAHANSIGSTHCFPAFRNAQWPKWIGCAMAAHENLAGGLIGLAGALFAAWLAYSGAQDQLRKLNDDARETARLRAVERFNQACTDLDALKLARGYLSSFAGNFPEETDSSYQAYDFAMKLRQMNQGAHVYLSQSAADAPSGFGRRITTVMWRMEKLAENIETQSADGVLNFTPINKEVRATLEGVRQITDDLGSRFPDLEKQVANLSDQVKSLSA